MDDNQVCQFCQSETELLFEGFCEECGRGTRKHMYNVSIRP